jgi:hypothetical protein
MIVLPDGLANPAPAMAAVDRASAAKARGVVAFTVGLGDSLDVDALRAIASRPEGSSQPRTPRPWPRSTAPSPAP